MKRFVALFLVLSVAILSGLAGYNYYKDEYGLFSNQLQEKRILVSERFVKMRYLVSHPYDYDAFCFGSSRVGNINLRQLQDGHHYYNMTYAEGVPKEWLHDLKILLNHDVKISVLMLGIDDFSFRVDPLRHNADFGKVAYEENNLKTYVSFLLKKPSFVAASDKVFFDVTGAGGFSNYEKDEKIEADPESHVEDPKFNKSMHYVGNRMPEALESLHEIKRLAEDHNIKLIVFFNPIHQRTYLGNNMNELNDFKRKLASVVDYYDFSGLNDITTNNYYYYETSHYRPMVGDMMLRVMNDDAKLAHGFGTYVTRDNVESHIEDLQREIQGDKG